MKLFFHTEQLILKNIPTDLSIEELKNNIESYSPFHSEKLKVINIRRFSKRVFDKNQNKFIYVPTPVIHVVVEGQEMPHKAYAYRVVHEVHTYYPQLRQCYN